MEENQIQNKTKSSKQTYIFIFLAVLIILGLAFYLTSNIKTNTTTDNSKPTATFEKCYNKVTSAECTGNTACMTNPASSFCECMGGTTKIQNTSDGQIGICQINGQEIDEWQYFRENTKAFQPQE